VDGIAGYAPQNHQRRQAADVIFS